MSGRARGNAVIAETDVGASPFAIAADNWATSTDGAPPNGDGAGPRVRTSPAGQHGHFWATADVTAGVTYPISGTVAFGAVDGGLRLRQCTPGAINRPRGPVAFSRASVCGGPPDVVYARDLFAEVENAEQIVLTTTLPDPATPSLGTLGIVIAPTSPADPWAVEPDGFLKFVNRMHARSRPPRRDARRQRGPALHDMGRRQARAHVSGRPDVGRERRGREP